MTVYAPKNLINPTRKANPLKAQKGFNMNNRNDIMNDLIFEVWIKEFGQDRRLASFRYRFLAEEFIEAQQKKSKHFIGFIIDTREETQNV